MWMRKKSNINASFGLEGVKNQGGLCMDFIEMASLLSGFVTLGLILERKFSWVALLFTLLKSLRKS